jgi:DNA-binding transcriptional MerR regulator
MDYPVHELAKLSGVSTRTLRYYDAIGLLRPLRTGGGGCRVYGPREVDRLQEILFYRALGVPLAEIGRILDDPGYDRAASLRAHLSSLQAEKQQLEALIANVAKTLTSMKGESIMQDREKFEGFQKKTLAENEAAYGRELRGRFGDEAIDASNAKFLNMRQEDWAKAESLRTAYEGLLQKALAAGDPAAPDAQEACRLHGQWLRLFWREGSYSKAAQAALGEGYASDERFRAYYEKLGPGCADFFRDALAVYARS